MIDRYGQTALHSGQRGPAPGRAGAWQGLSSRSAISLASPDVPSRMIEVFQSGNAGKDLAERLMLALEAGLDAGGETGDEHAAGLHVADTYDWPVVDLRVDWHDEPIAELRRVWTSYAPQRAAYESRARTPGTAPSF